MLRRRSTSLTGAPPASAPSRPLRGRSAYAAQPGESAASLSLWSSLRWTLALLVVLGVLVYLLRSVLAMLVAASAFAYLLDPVVDRFEARGRSRELGIGVIFAGTLLILVLGFLFLVPAIAHQISALSGNIGEYLSQLTLELEPYRTWAEEQTGLSFPFSIHALGQELPNYLERLSPDAQNSIRDFLGQALSSGLGFVITVINLALLPIFVFYILRDWDRIVERIGNLVPLRHRSFVGRIVSEIDERLSSFVRGQITVCLVLGVLYSAGLWLLSGIDLPIVVGMLSGLLFIIPYLGTVVGVLLATVLALLKFGLDYHVLVVWAVFGGIQALEGTVLTPNIVGDKVGLHPLVVMIALLVGGNLLGLWGMLVAIPITAALSVLFRTFIQRYRKSSFYGD